MLIVAAKSHKRHPLPSRLERGGHIRHFSKSQVVQISLGVALVAVVVLGMRGFGYEHSGARHPRIGLNPRPPDDPPFHVDCDAIISEIFHSSEPNCATLAREKVPGLIIESLAAGLVVLVILVGLSRSNGRRTIESPISDSSSDVADQLARFAQLHRSGDLSDDEFAAAKRSLLG